MTINPPESPVNFSPPGGGNGGGGIGGAVRLHDGDNIVVVLDHLARGETISPFGVRAADAIPRGHKAAIRPIRAGDGVVKYGQIIGVAGRDIAPGEHAHIHNMSMADFDREYAFGEHASPVEMIADAERATFRGYARPDGRFGT
ncbi:MAG: UxaA family hydrolase, partial [Gammaproteobacteria bacterium]